MYIAEYECSVEAALDLIMEDASANLLKELITDRVFDKLSHADVRKRYIDYGGEFLAANADMLAKEYPTRSVSFPRKYVDSVIMLFGFTPSEFKSLVRQVCNTVAAKNWNHIMNSLTNVIHSIVIVYADMIQNRQLRDSARQQLSLTMWSKMYQKFWASTPVLNEAVMAYTYSELNQTWDIVKAENMISWIVGITEGAYGLYRTKMDTGLTAKVMIDFLNEIRNRFNQSTRLIANRYYENIEKQQSSGGDVSSSDEYVDTNAYSTIRDNLMRLIKNGDRAYWTMGDLYKGIARYKNIDVDDLFAFATQKIQMKDVGEIMNLIFYVFLNKEGNSVKDINSTKYINRITNFPTAIDRAIQGKPVIIPLAKKYEVEQELVRVFVCFIATYIMQRINDVNNQSKGMVSYD
jgi:hypothetical protein